MNFKVTPNNLTRLEKIFSEIKYELRFEKGTFNSGYCVLEHKKVVVINKFLNLEGRINSLLDILSTMQLDDTLLTPESLKLYKQIVENRNALQAAEAAEEVAEAAAAAEAEAAKTAEAAASEKASAEVTTAEAEQPSTEAEKSPSDNTSEEENPSPTQPSEN
jgi:peptidoglycan hydrolase CwlO-like protein